MTHMKNLTGLIVFLIFPFLYLTAQGPTYSKLRVYANDLQIQELAKSGIDVTEGILKKGVFLISDFSAEEILKIESLKLQYDILIEDVAGYYAERNVGKSANVLDYKGIGDWEVPANFTFGSMSGHATFTEIVAHLDNMYNLFPNLITAKESIGQSIEGRDIWMVKISDNPNMSEPEPQVFYNALTHAREPAGAMTLLFYMYYLLEQYSSDDLIQTLVDNTEMYFVLCVNPDGYVYNQTTNPNGGGMFRKNRRINSGSSCIGVDLNRNYGYFWGLDNNGSSPDPCSETYRGSAAFSEPETAAIRDFVEANDFKNILNYHTYSNLLLYPWGYTSDPCPDDAIFYAHASLMTQDNNYVFGSGNSTIYATNGGADDWMYGEQITKPKSFAYTPELGGNDDGFWCPVSRIIPIAQENMIQNLLAAAFAGKYADVKETSPTIIGDVAGFLNFDITRLGLMDGGTFTVTLIPISDVITSVGEPKVFSGMDILESISDSIEFILNPGILSGTLFKFLLSVENGDYVLSDTITKVFGVPVVIFEDDCNTMNNWSSATWGVTGSSYYSPPGSITDSPSGNYPNNHTGTVVLTQNIDLSDVAFAVLNFWAKWEIEPGWDYCQLSVSTNNGSTWQPLTGKYTVTGNSNQANGQPLYDGFQTTWVREEIDLSEYIGNSVIFRFRLKSDGWVTEDGFYFDDFAVSVVEIETTGFLEKHDMYAVLISDPMPNPAKDQVKFSLLNAGSYENLSFSVMNVSGQEIFTMPVTGDRSGITLGIGDWKPGIYFYRLTGPSVQTEVKKLIVH
ncbi:MAG: M14 family zinc carboxypeptidase [Bacteroidales bacterium]